MQTPFDTARLRLRRWARDDLADVRALLGDPDVMRFSDAGALDCAACKDWLRRALRDDPKVCTWAVLEKRSAPVIGYLRLSRASPSAGPTEIELGLRFLPRVWGRGYAVEVAQAVLSPVTGFEGCTRVIACVDPNNTRSVAVLRKLGMRHLRDVMLPGYDHPDHVYGLDLGAGADGAR